MRYIASAPGKIIITGEHFVVHGAYALAAAIEKMVFVSVQPSDSLEITSKNLGLKSSLNNMPDRLRPIFQTLEATQNCLGERRPVRLMIDSEIPVSSGLGSSSAVSVATVAAASAFYGHKLSKDEMIRLAMVGERAVHGNPSGIDVIIAALGNAILFKRNHEPISIKTGHHIQFLIINTGIERRTSDMIDHVARFKQRYPKAFDELLHSADYLSHLASDSLLKGDIIQLANIVNLNQQLLRRVGVSSEKVEDVVKATLELGCLGSKVTGGGGGGCVLSIPKLNDGERVANILKSRNMDCFLTHLPVDGVKVWQEAGF